jgi:hypothetical protein
MIGGIVTIVFLLSLTTDAVGDRNTSLNHLSPNHLSLGTIF